MIDLVLVGIGTGNPEHLTLQAVRTLNTADLILIPRKGDDKADLAELRHAICAQVVTNPATRIVTFDMPRRDTATPDYRQSVDHWHDAIAQAWQAAISANLPPAHWPEEQPEDRPDNWSYDRPCDWPDNQRNDLPTQPPSPPPAGPSVRSPAQAPANRSGNTGTIALLVWGDPALYDSTLRIAARLTQRPRTVRSIPGIMSLNMLAAAHGIALNDIGAPFLVTTGRQLRDHGWPPGTDTVVVMLDGDCSFRHIPAAGVTIYWGAYVGMAEQILCSGPLAQAGPGIVATRAEARARHGWIMDIYLLRRAPRATEMAAHAPEPEPHGGQVREVMRDMPDAPHPFIDLSTGINPQAYPLAMPPVAALTRLPETDEEDDLRTAAATAYGAASPRLIAAGPGSQSLISLLPRLTGASTACILGPTYSGHATAWRQAGKTVQTVTDPEHLAEHATLPGTVCIVCNPNNPDGRLLPATLLLDLAERCATHGNHLVVDEAFADFDGQSVIPALPQPGLIVLRSFGKTYGLPGVRLGFLLASDETAKRARDMVGAWPVGTLALAAGRQALRDTRWLGMAAQTAAAAKSRLTTLLDKAGLHHQGQARLFTLVRTRQAQALWTHLRRYGIVTRRFCAMPDALRFGLPGDEQAWNRLEDALLAWRSTPP
ncbi:MAG: threonine-phosphate decarboxylase CobD [Acetobacter sp.]|uniref:threonine-phosphate decarboxylase CobD n=1 Tax=Acetobacter sp. TaxID=440 RepID=UPI0039E91708